jgi:hypothetical protein
MKLFLIFTLFTTIVLQVNPFLKLGRYECYSPYGNGFLTVLKNNTIYADFGSCYGERYLKGIYKTASDTLIATILYEDDHKIKNNQHTSVNAFDLKFLIRTNFLICINCPFKIDTLRFIRPVSQKSK